MIRGPDGGDRRAVMRASYYDVATEKAVEIDGFEISLLPKLVGVVLGMNGGRGHPALELCVRTAAA
jgi:hypothetical protein